MYLRLLLPAAATMLLLSSPSFADRKPMPPGQAKKISRSVPRPIAALGLPAGVAIGGYVWWRRRAQKEQKAQ